MDTLAADAFHQTTQNDSPIAQKAIVLIMKDGWDGEEKERFFDMFVSKLQEAGDNLGLFIEAERPEFENAQNAHGLPRTAIALNFAPTEAELSPFRLMNEGGLELKALAVLAGVESMVFKTDHNAHQNFCVSTSFQRLQNTPSEEFPFVLE